MEFFDTLAANSALFISCCVALGLLIGSFLNVVIYRLPIMMNNEWRADCRELNGEPPVKQPAFNLVTPRSACPGCGAPITALQNIPLVSWLVLRGKCAKCKTPISARYPFVELLTGIASGIVAWRFGYGTLSLAGLFFTWLLIATTFIDLDTQLLPDDLTYPLLWIGLLLSVTLPVWDPGLPPLTPADSIIGAIVGYLSLWTIAKLFFLLRRMEGMGGGDFKLFAAFGAWFGWKMLLPIILFASCVGSVIGLYILYRQRKGLDTQIPFGPYLALAGWLFLLVGPQVVDRYLALYTHAP
jgi:leader peptidase (prepilin peptidase)/N-methyltransferase